MDRKHRFRMLKPHLMQYIHSGGEGCEPVFRELLRQERIVREELSGQVGQFAYGRPHGKSWDVVFNELSQILSPVQVQQLASRLLRDTREICMRLHEMSEIEKILVGEFGGEG